MAKRVWPGLPSYSLDRLLNKAGITVDDRHGKRHRAGWDSYATACLFTTMLTELDPDHLIEIACLPALAPRPEPQGGLW